MDIIPCHVTRFECLRSSRYLLEIARTRLTREKRVKLEYHFQKIFKRTWSVARLSHWNGASLHTIEYLSHLQSKTCWLICMNYSRVNPEIAFIGDAFRVSSSYTGSCTAVRFFPPKKRCVTTCNLDHHATPPHRLRTRLGMIFSCSNNRYVFEIYANNN